MKRAVTKRIERGYREAMEVVEQFDQEVKGVGTWLAGPDGQASGGQHE